jgi:hypothetical protein
VYRFTLAVNVQISSVQFAWQIPSLDEMAARETLAEDARRVKNQTDFDWNMFFLLKVVSKKVIG